MLRITTHYRSHWPIAAVGVGLAGRSCSEIYIFVVLAVVNFDHCLYSSLLNDHCGGFC